MVLLQNTIGFSLFTPGVLTPLAALSAILLARDQTPEPRRPGVATRAIPVCLAGAGLVTFGWLMLIPVARSSCLLAQARSRPDRALDLYARGAAADPLDPTPLLERAQVLSHVRTLESLSAALKDIDQAILRAPNTLALYDGRSQVLQWRYQVSDAAVDLLGAMGAARHVVALYPASPPRPGTTIARLSPSMPPGRHTKSAAGRPGAASRSSNSSRR
jgi:hypothetical protein